MMPSFGLTCKWKVSQDNRTPQERGMHKSIYQYTKEKLSKQKATQEGGFRILSSHFDCLDTVLDIAEIGINSNQVALQVFKQIEVAGMLLRESL